jgi:hypothetical protein
VIQRGSGLTHAEQASVEATSDAALTEAVTRMSAIARDAEPGLGTSSQVTEGVAWEAVRRQRKASLLIEARQQLLVRELIDTAGTFGAFGESRAPAHHASLSMGGDDVMVLIDGVPLYDPAFLDAQVDPLFEPPGLIGRPERLPHTDLPGWQPEEAEPEWGGLRGPDDLDFERKLDTGPCAPWRQPEPCREPEPGEVASSSEVGTSTYTDDWGTAYGFWPLNVATRPCRLVLLLPGVLGVVDNEVEHVARSYAMAGYRVLALDWPTQQCSVRKLCAGEAAYVDDQTWQDCVLSKRAARLAWIADRVGVALSALGGDWLDFLNVAGAPRWGSIIHAGYSEGANQVSYNSRHLPSAGAIYLSGGADAARPDPDDVVPSVSPCPDIEETDLHLAEWVTQMQERRTRVGYVHEGESFEVTEGWDANGLEPSLVFFGDSVATLAEFRGSARLYSSTTEGTPHTSIKVNTPQIHLVNTYLVCRAGGVL